MRNLNTKNGWQIYPLFLLTAIVLYLLYLVSLNKRFDHDEFEHIHSAWYIAQGFVPYKDFFQNHNPLLWFLIAPVIALAGDNALLPIYFRIAMLAVSLCIAASAAGIALQITSRIEAGLYCIILLLSTILFVEKSVELRPDVPMTLFETLSAYFLVRYFDTARSRDMYFSGISASIAYLFLQKAIFLYGALSLLIIIMALRKDVPKRSVLYFFLILSAGPALSFLYAASQGALSDYYLNGYLLNISKLYSFSPWLFLKISWNKNPGFWCLAGAGFLYGIYSIKVDKKFGFISMLSILLLLPVFFNKLPWKQYYMPALTFFSITGACFLTRLLEKVGAGLILGSILMAVIIFNPIMSLIEYNKESNNNSQIKLIDYVMRNTKRDDLVYDGDCQFNLFRKDLHYFWYSTGRNKNLYAYNRLTNNKYGDYDICSLISQKRPRIVSDFMVNKRECGVFKMYRRTRFPHVFYID
jgi:hypothetical protein